MHYEWEPSWKELTPEKALVSCFFLINGTIRDGVRGKPGEVIMRASDRVREALKNLRSEDIQNVRIDWFLPKEPST